jgi:uncharacterized membrane protein
MFNTPTTLLWTSTTTVLVFVGVFARLFTVRISTLNAVESFRAYSIKGIKPGMNSPRRYACNSVRTT